MASQRAKTALLAAVAGSLIAWNWMRLERSPNGWQAALVVVLAIAPALARSLGARIVASLVAFVVVAGTAFDLGLGVDEPGRVLSRSWDGFLAFYDVRLPFDGAFRPHMHGVILLAVFAFTLVAGLAIAARRPGPRGARAARRRGLARDAARRARADPRRGDPGRPARAPRRHARAASDGRLRACGRGGRRPDRAARIDLAGAREARVSQLADLGPDDAPGEAGCRLVRLGLALRRPHLSTQADDRPARSGPRRPLTTGGRPC